MVRSLIGTVCDNVRRKVRGTAHMDTGRGGGHMKYLENVDSAKPISRIGLGTWQFGSREWGYGDQYNARDADQIVARAAELGITLFDTAEMYGFGRSETILGAALAAHDLHRHGLHRDQALPAVPDRPAGAQDCAGQRWTTRRLDHRPVPGPSAQSDRPGRHHDGGHA